MIGIIFAGNIEYCPYIDKYIDAIKKNKETYEVLYWNRDLLKNNGKYISKSYDYKMDNSKPKHLKIFDFIKYRNWLLRQLKVSKYKKIIILETLSGILIKKYLVKKYAKKFIFDIRDYSYESNNLFHSIENQVIEKSFFTCISSEGFKEFLPRRHEYILVHNFSYSDVVQKNNFHHKRRNYGERINLVWIGSVRYFDHQVKIIKSLRNDERFNVIFHGTGPDLVRLTSYCNENKVDNVFFTGRYDNSEKRNLLENADILHNSYDINIGKEVLYAISNKFYDGIIYKIPQIVENGTFKHNLVKELNIGIGLDVNNDSFANDLYDYYFNINFKLFSETCDYELTKILEQDRIYINKIEEFISI